MKGVSVAVWAVAAWTVGVLGVSGAKTTRFLRLENTVGKGNVIVTLKVRFCFSRHFVACVCVRVSLYECVYVCVCVCICANVYEYACLCLCV